MKAKIYKQGTPKAVGFERDGKTHIFEANLQYMGSVEGTVTHIWSQAKKICLNPVLDIRP